MQKNEVGPLSNTSSKTNSKRVVKDLRAKTVKLLEENMGEKLMILDLVIILCIYTKT